MAKRRFTSAQIKRLKNIQAKRMERAHKHLSAAPDSLATLGPEEMGIIITHHSVMVVVQSNDGRLINCTLRQNLGTLVTGDNVIWQALDDNTGVVVACLPRRSVILRPFGRGTKPIVANIDLMVIVVALAPLPQETTIDRYLILAQSMKLDAFIVVNKIDLLSTHEHHEIMNRMRVYQSLGYSVINVSTTRNMGLHELASKLKGLNSIVVGQSGVGKSSLINTLVPNSAAITNTLSQRDKFGRQTTSSSRLYHLPNGGNLIDSPGIHQFSLTHFSPEEILKGFREFQPYLGQCQFRNCLHEQEPNCALQKAVKDHKIASFRLKNYRKIIEPVLKHI